MKEDYTVIFTSDSWMLLNKYKPMSVEMLEAWIVFFLLFTPAAMVFGFIGERTSILWGLLMIFPVFLTVVLKRKIADGKVFFILNVLVISLIYVLSSGLIHKIVFALIQGVFFIKYFRDRNEGNTRFWDFIALIINGVFFSIYFVIASQMKIEFLLNFITVVSINNVICLLIYYHITRRNNLLAWERNDADRLMSKMKKTSTYVILVTSASIILLNMALWKLGMFSMMDSIFSGISFNSDSQNIISQPKSIDTASQEAVKMRMPLDGGEPSKIVNIIITFFEVIVIIILAIMAVYLLWALAVKLKEFWRAYFGWKELSNEKREFVFDEASGVNIVSQINKIKKIIGDNLDFSNRKKIRNCYKKIIKKHQGKGKDIPKYQTAVEMLQEIEDITQRPYKEAALIYDKARYGMEDCSDNDVARIKKYL